MKCYASPLDVCHNIVRCEFLGKCFYEKELMNFLIETSSKVPLDTIIFVKDGKQIGKITGINMDKTAKDNQTDVPIQHFQSGASSSGNVPPYECLTPTLLRRAAIRMQKGMDSYGKHNWKKGAKDKQFILDRLNHAIEHLVKAAHEIDDDDNEMQDDDLAAVVVNCMFAMEYQNAIIARQNQENQNPMAGIYATEDKQSSQIVINPAFEHALRKIINIHGIDNQMNIADNALASLLVNHLYKIKGQMY